MGQVERVRLLEVVRMVFGALQGAAALNDVDGAGTALARTLLEDADSAGPEVRLIGVSCAPGSGGDGSDARWGGGDRAGQSGLRDVSITLSVWTPPNANDPMGLRYAAVDAVLGVVEAAHLVSADGRTRLRTATTASVQPEDLGSDERPRVCTVIRLAAWVTRRPA